MSRCDICADCGAPEPTWASVNRGVLICDECCSIHRSLGRHISQTKSLKKGQWKSTQLAMVHQLVGHGANNIWEHTLLEPVQNKPGRRKPNPKDQVHPTKADFIRAKYQFLAFLNKHKDVEMGSAEDLNKQLHSSVRTSNLETSLRLLSLGADPNYFHPERGNYPLHVAAQVGQLLQVELLLVYGADPGAFDAGGRTPAEHAKTACHADLADRIVECQYELTDRLAFYLCGRKPDHRAGQHFIIPQMSDSSLDLSELAKAAKKKLMALSNHLFEELAMDVYDEVDRRENETIWLSMQGDNSIVSDRQTVPFLPVNPQFSATRNQGRQKLARFNAREFATLIIDILSDARHRQQGPVQGESRTGDGRAKVNSVVSDDEPLYDSVASDEDYSSIGDNQSLKGEKTFSDKNFDVSVESSEQSDTPITVEEYLDVKKTLIESQTKVQQMSVINTDLKQEISLLNTMVNRLMQEKQAPHSDAEDQFVDAAPSDRRFRVMKRESNRPQSMFEPRESTARLAQSIAGKDDKCNTLSRSKPSSSSVKYPLKTDVHSGNSAESDYDNAQVSEREETVSVESVDAKSETPELQDAPEGSTVGEGVTAATASNLPRQQDVVKQTEKITKKIQQLLVSAQEGKADSYNCCSDKIFAAVNEMTALFPQSSTGDLAAALQSLQAGASQLLESCQKVGEGDDRLRTQRVIQCAYDIAKAAKQIVLLFN